MGLKEKLHSSPVTLSPPLLGYSTNQLAYIENNVMKQMMQHPLSWPFRKPVDPVKLKIPDYHDVIKEPMDFGTIEKKLKSDTYRNAKECITDFNRVFSNCYIFNQPDNEVVETAKDLEKFFLGRLTGMPPIEWEVEAQAKYEGKEGFGLQDHLSSYFSTGVKQRRRQITERLVVGSASSRRSLACGEKVAGQVRPLTSKSRSQVDIGIVGSHSEESAEITKQMKQSSGNMCDVREEKGKRSAPVFKKVVNKMKRQVDKARCSSKGKGKPLVSKVGNKNLKGDGRETSSRKEQKDKICQDSKLKCSGPTLENKSSRLRGALDPLISNMMQNLKEASRSHESMASSAVEEVLMKHNMRKMKDKLDLIRNCMEVVQKNPNPNLVGEIRASVGKLEGAMGSGQHGGRRRRRNHAEYSCKSYTDWAEVAARSRNGVDLVKRNMGEGLQSRKGEHCEEKSSGMEKDTEEDISDLLRSEDDDVKEALSHQIINQLLSEMLNKVVQFCEKVAQSH